MGIARVKILLIKRFLGKRLRLKGFLTQIKLKLYYKGEKLLIALDQVVYIGLFLIGRILEQFKPYLTKLQKNGIDTTNLEV